MARGATWKEDERFGIWLTIEPLLPRSPNVYFTLKLTRTPTHPPQQPTIMLPSPPAIPSLVTILSKSRHLRIIHSRNMYISPSPLGPSTFLPRLLNHCQNCVIETKAFFDTANYSFSIEARFFKKPLLCQRPFGIFPVPKLESSTIIMNKVIASSDLSARRANRQTYDRPWLQSKSFFN